MSNVGELELAIAEASRLISEHPDMFQYWRWRAVPRLVIGDIEGAAADVRMANSLVPPNVWALAIEATIAAHAGDTAETRRIRDEYTRIASQQWMPVQWLGRIEQALGDYDAAFALYDRAYHAREHLLTVLHTDRQFRLIPPGRTDSICDDPRWSELLRRIGLALN
jgi:tetratricopeptide (TPR) repeat protein